MSGFDRSTVWRYYIVVCLDVVAMKAAMPTDENGAILWPWGGNRSPLLRPGHYEDIDDGHGGTYRIYVTDPGPERAALVAVKETDVPGRDVIKAHCTVKRLTKGNGVLLQQQFPQFKFKELGSFASVIVQDTAPDYDGD